ncbi:MAG: hypothetical protein WAP35_01285 [Solirubrobacterales bacterium]
MNSAFTGQSARHLKALAIAFSIALAILVIPSTAAASGSGSGFYSDVCAIEASPTIQIVDIKAPGAKAVFKVQATKKPDFVKVRKTWFWTSYYEDVKTWGCNVGGGAPAAPNVPAPNIKVTWLVTDGPNKGATGNGYTDSNGEVKFSYTGCGCGKDIVKLYATERWCETPNTPLNICAPGEIKTYILSDIIKVEWTNCSNTPPPPTGPTGPTSPTGPTGPTSPTGPTGPTSPTGPTGPTSPTGPTGPTSPTGPTGPTSPTGPTGPTSPTGPTGPTSPTGPTGPTSPTGPTEPTSPTGPTGAVNPTTVVKGQLKPLGRVSLSKRCNAEYLLIKPSSRNGTPSSITIYLGSKKVKRITKSPFSYKLPLTKVGKGTKTVRVVFRFADGSAQTVTKAFKNCARLTANARRAPAFTG